MLIIEVKGSNAGVILSEAVIYSGVCRSPILCSHTASLTNIFLCLPASCESTKPAIYLMPYIPCRFNAGGQLAHTSAIAWVLPEYAVILQPTDSQMLQKTGTVLVVLMAQGTSLRSLVWRPWSTLLTEGLPPQGCAAAVMEQIL